MPFIDLTIIGLAIVIYLGWLFVWSLHLVAILYGKYKFHKKPHLITQEKQKLPGVSIIKPLMGVDTNLADNLETFFNIEYPLYEVLFCVQDNTDPVISVVKELMIKYPLVNAQLFIGGKQIGINPKINNMIQGWDAAKYNFVLISDAGLKMEKDTLLDMASLMTDKIGLVHQMPFVSDRNKGFASNLEKVYFGTCHCRMYLAINFFGINCVTGMSCLMRKSVIDESGGLKAFSHFIAEDYFLAQEFLNKGWLIQLSHQPAQQNSGTYSVSIWQSRMIRWCKLRLKLNIMSWLEPAQECLLIGVATSWATNFLFEWNSLVFLLIHMLCWFLSDYTLLRITQNSKLAFSKFEFVVTWFYRETICYYLFMKAAVNPTVQWRHGKYRLKWGGLAEEICADAASLNLKKQPLNIVEAQFTTNLQQEQQQKLLEQRLSHKFQANLFANKMEKEKHRQIRHQHSHSASPVLLNFINTNHTDTSNQVAKPPTASLSSTTTNHV